MVLPKDVNPEEVMHPTGVFFRNPTHKEEADMADNQSEIVEAIKATKRERVSQTLTYTEEDKPWILPGFKFIKQMDEMAIEQLCKTLMRYRPNIFKVHIKLGDYPNAQQISNHKTKNLSSFKPRFHTDVAKKLAEILSDRTMNVTEVIYTVYSADPGNFRAVGEVFGKVSDEEYDDPKLDNPALRIEYFTN